MNELNQGHNVRRARFNSSLLSLFSLLFLLLLHHSLLLPFLLSYFRIFVIGLFLFSFFSLLIVLASLRLCVMPSSRHLCPLPEPCFQGVRHRSRKSRWRRGSAVVEHMMILAFIVVPCTIFIMAVAPRIMRYAYEMVAMLISWPFM
jgi:hypothetical protein